jgi:hypothetical protein
LDVAVHRRDAYVIGSTEGTLPEQARAGSSDAFLRKYTANGEEVWTRQFGTAAHEQALATAVDDTGVVVAGVTEGALPTHTSAGHRDVYVRKYDLQGNELWTRQLGSPGEDRPADIVLDTTGVYVLLTTEDSRPPWGSAVALQKLDPHGNPLWVRQFGTSASERAVTMLVDPAGVYIGTMASGTSEATTGYFREGFLRKFDVDGNEQWKRTLGPVQAEYRFTLAMAHDGVYLIRALCSRVAPETGDVAKVVVHIDKYDRDGTALWRGEIKTDCSSTPYVAWTTDNGVFLVEEAGVLRVTKLSLAGGGDGFSAWSSRLPFFGATAALGVGIVALRRRPNTGRDMAW